MSVAQVPSLVSFTPGTTILSGDVNSNLTALRNAVNALITGTDTLALGLTLPAPVNTDVLKWGGSASVTTYARLSTKLTANGFAVSTNHDRASNTQDDPTIESWRLSLGPDSFDVTSTPASSTTFVSRVSLTVSGGFVISVPLVVTGSSTLGGNVTVTGNAVVSGTASVGGAMTITGALTVTGAAAITGAIAVSGNAVLGGTVALGGAVGSGLKFILDPTGASVGTDWYHFLSDGIAASNDWNLGYGGSTSVFQVRANGTVRLKDVGGLVVAAATLATAATAGFLYIPTINGTPTGTPATQTGTVPIVYDVNSNLLYVYAGGGWKKSTAYS